jgi:hypothetical protein
MALDEGNKHVTVVYPGLRIIEKFIYFAGNKYVFIIVLYLMHIKNEIEKFFDHLVVVLLCQPT